jgi:hypothetical protein
VKPLPRGSIWATVATTAFFLACVACMLFGAWDYIRL